MASDTLAASGRAQRLAVLIEAGNVFEDCRALVTEIAAWGEASARRI